MRNLILCLCFCLLLGGAGVVAGTERAERPLSFAADLSAGHALRVENLLGSIEIRGGGEEDQILIEGHVAVEAETAEAANALADAFRIAADDSGTLRVVFPVERHTVYRLPRSEADGLVSRWVTPLVRRNTVSVEYDGATVEIGKSKGALAVVVHLTVTVPLDVRASFKQAVGTIDARASRGSLELEIVQGRIHARQLFGKLAARAGGGNVTVSSFQGQELSVRSSSGDIELLDVRADKVLLQTASGRIYGQGLRADNVSIDSNTGDVRLDEFDPTACEVRTGSGAVDLGIRLKYTREASIYSTSGDVTLRVGKMAYFDLMTETGSGAIKSKGVSLELVEQEDRVARYRRGGGGADLKITADSGDILVRPLARATFFGPTGS